MSSASWSGGLTDAESADVNSRVERFRAAWSPDGSTDLNPVLPPPGAHHRLAVLVQVIIADMQQRAEVRLPFRVERYVNMFPEDLQSQTVPAELLTAEYRLRHQYTDRPPLSEYERWFPDQFPAIAEALKRDPVVTSNLNPTVVASAPTMPRRSAIDQTPLTVSAADVLPSDTPYRLSKKLGEGAFGEVFEAYAPGGVRVAVKRITRNTSHAASKAEQESLEAIKNLSHPFLLKTNAYWVFEDRLVIVMELADGSLADRIEYHKTAGRMGIPPEELIPLFDQAGDALDYLHKENVSHRDVKPENILILRGYAKVADFGLVRTHEHTMTTVGNTAGTPAYMAPEMWQQKVSLQSDQYSLAATYVRCRLGRHLFQTTVLVDMANSHINALPDLAPLSPAEQKVLLKALSKNPDHRYPSCKEFAKALQAAVFPLPEPPKPTAAPGSAPSPLVLALTVGVAVAVAVAGAVAAVLFFMMPKPQTTPTDDKADKGTPPVVVQQKSPQPVSFPDWNADPTAGAPKEIKERFYPLRLTREVAGERLAAVLIYPTEENADHPPPFYMLENKVTNRVFAAVWKELKDDNDSDFHQLNADARNSLVKEAWNEFAKARAPDTPVLGVTFVEGLLVARRLGGTLPLLGQWRKAIGAMERGTKELAVGAPSTLKDAQEAAARGLALAQANPLPVGTKTQDVSYWKIRQLATNGREWIGQANDTPARIALSSELGPTNQAIYVGESYASATVISLAEVRRRPKECDLDDTVKQIGFRVVLEPK